MKENFNIENLVNQKLQNFEADVNPAVWAKVQAGIGAGAVVSTGISTGLKIGLISGGIIAASVITYFAAFNNTDNTVEPKTESTEMVDKTLVTNHESDNQLNESIIVVEDKNDPVIIENQQKIETELRQNKNSNVSNHSSTTSTDNGVGSNNSSNTTTTVVQTNNTANNNQVGNETGTVVNDKEPEKTLQPSGRIDYSITGNIPAVVTLKANAQNSKEIKWDFGDGTVAQGEEVKHTYSKAGSYKIRLTVIGNKGLVYEEMVEIVVKTKSSIDNIPNVITPNGDRINDYFSVKSTEIETFTITILDAKGNEVFFSNDKDFVWDGTDKSGETVDKGMCTYIIIAEGKDGSIIKLPGSLYVQ